VTTATFARWCARLALAVAATGLVAACADTTAATKGVIVIANPADDVVVTSPPATVPADSRTETSRDDLAGERRASPTEVWVDDADSRLLHVRYPSAPAPCTAARVAVDEGTAVVRVVLFLGTPPEGVGEPCRAIAVEREVVVTLDRALGTREVLFS
jgi:hypothetical protein